MESFESPKKCLVTGAAGFLGAELTKQLIVRGFQVRAMFRRAEGALNLHKIPVEVFVGDINDEDVAVEAMEGIDYVFHAASVYVDTPYYDHKAEAMYRTNVNGVANICEAALKQKVKKVIYTSSTGAVGKRDDGLPSDETINLNKLTLRSHYEKSKSMGEKLALSYSKKGLFVVAINPSFLIGPGDLRPTPTGEIIVKYLNQAYPCYFDANVCLSDVKSTAKAHLDALEYGRNGERYIVMLNQTFSIAQLFSVLEKVSGVKKPKLKLPLSLLLPFSIINESIIGLLGLRGKIKPLVSYEIVKYLQLKCEYSSEKAKKELKFIPGDLENVLSEAVRWYMRNGYVKKSSRVKYYRELGKL